MGCTNLGWNFEATRALLVCWKGLGLETRLLSVNYTALFMKEHWAGRLGHKNVCTVLYKAYLPKHTIDKITEQAIFDVYSPDIK